MTTTTMYEVYERREAIANSEWSIAFNRLQREVADHPSFRSLVREVAIVEQPHGDRHAYNRWLRTASWAPWSWIITGPGPSRRRADYFTEAIADDLNLWERFGQPGDALAAVYVCARDWVNARQIPS